jgi:hypothetical protein
MVKEAGAVAAGAAATRFASRRSRPFTLSRHPSALNRLPRQLSDYPEEFRHFGLEDWGFTNIILGVELIVFVRQRRKIVR